MPSPGPAALRSALAVPYTVEGGHPTQFQADGQFITDLAAAIDAGWTCASPTTPSTFAEAFTAAFAHITGGGAPFLQCVASGLDDEVDAWIASWDSEAGIHTYAPSSASIVSRITGCSSLSSAGVTALAEAVADAFVASFEQEVG